MKKFLLSALLSTLALLSPLSARADAGCALQLTVDAPVTAMYGIVIFIIPSSVYYPIVAIPPGTAFTGDLNNGDLVTISIDPNKAPCGGTSSISWGMSQWWHCGTPSAPIRMFVGGTFLTDDYVAYTDCQCPNTGSGMLFDEEDGIQCMKMQPAPQPTPPPQAQ